MKYIRKIPDRKEDCKKCPLKQPAQFLMEKKNGKQITVCGYHYGRERGYIE